jgi:hypothetical protein
MWFRHRAWIPIAWLLSLINLGGVWFAARPAEPWHATIHALLAVLFALGAQRLRARQVRTSGPTVTTSDNETGELPQAVDAMQNRLEELEERLDFTERLLTKYREGDRLGSPPR